MKRVALVTGAGRGIGRGIALELAAHGWDVAINYHSNAEAASETAQKAQELGARAVTIQADVANVSDRARLLETVRSGFGRLDLLVNNAGMAPRVRRDLLEMTPESYHEVMSTNLTGPVFLTQAAALWMIDEVKAGLDPKPLIINISSMSAYTVSLNRGEYCIAKAGMGMMTALFAARLAEWEIPVYEVRPGIIATDMTAGVQEKYARLIDDGLLPVRRMGQPGDVAKAVLALAEGALCYSTGEVINVDGGFHLRRL